MPTCNKCGGFVTRNFVRVFGSNEEEVYACPNCSSLSELMERGGAEQEL